MRHRNDLAKLGRPRAHRKALLCSLVRSLFLYESIKTTLPKAKAAQRLAERLVSRSRRDDLAARRYAYVHLGDHGLVKRLFEEISPRFEDRDSGFTRIFMLGSRLGDGAQMAVLEMTVKGEVKKKKTKSAAKTAAESPAKETGKSKAKAKEKEKSRKKKETARDRESDSAKKKPAPKKKSG